jgi:hypothetical protein
MPQSRQALIAFLRAASRDTSLLDYQIMMAKAADEMEAQDAEQVEGKRERTPPPC